MFPIAIMLYQMILFVILTPGLLLRIPPRGSLLMAAVVHSLVFALIFHFTHKFVGSATESFDSMSGGADEEEMGHSSGGMGMGMGSASASASASRGQRMY
jgi:hypothetical protein